MESRTGGPAGRGLDPQAASTRFLLGLALGAAGQLIPGSGSLDRLSAVMACSGLLLGWAGGGGAVVGSAVLLALRTGSLPSPVLVASEAAAAWVPFAVFHLAPRFLRVGRRLPNTTSFLVFLLASICGAAASAPLATMALFGRLSWPAVATWWAAIAASIVLLVPIPLLVLPRRWWLAVTPVPGELVRDHLLRLWRPGVVGAAAAVVLLGLTYSFLGLPATPVDPWLALLYVPPIAWAAWRGGLRGGLLIGCLAGLAFLAQVSAEPGGRMHDALLVRQAGTLFFPLLGGIWGGAREREKRVLRRLRAANRRLRGHLGNLVQALRSALSAKDAYTEGHVERVRQYALATGERLGMPRQHLDLLEVASLLHDIGKIGVPEEVLHKHGPLDRREVAQMRLHPEIGARMVEDLEELREAAPLIRHHQERFDGATDGRYPGYPDGLRGDEIPLGARIIAVVDAFDAMTSDRSYRQALSDERARATLLDERARQFDPRVVDAFLEVLEQRPW